MKFNINSTALFPVVSKVTKPVSDKSPLPILSNLLVTADESGLRFVGSNMEMQISDRVQAEVSEPGSATIPAKKLLEICRKLPPSANMLFSLKGEKLTISSGRSRFNMITLPTHDYPEIDNLSSGVCVSMAKDELESLLEKVGISMAIKDARNFLNGLLFEVGEGYVRGVSTDGFRLSRKDLAVPNNVSDVVASIIPNKAVDDIKNLLKSYNGDVVLCFTETALSLTFGEAVLISKLVDAKYPDYERIIPRDLDLHAFANGTDLKEALLRASILSNNVMRVVLFSFDNGLLTISAKDQKDMATDEVEIDYNGPNVVLGLKVDFVIDVLGALDNDLVELTFNEAAKCIVLKNVDKENELFIVMGIRI